MKICVVLKREKYLISSCGGEGLPVPNIEYGRGRLALT
jgi:hypothetical protein